ncbi:hypothetical protein FRC15_004240 [Serendipita sp. 397]|nr:hypothetical protein FRC15_004240 [Serendipita sp. 397]
MNYSKFFLTLLLSVTVLALPLPEPEPEPHNGHGHAILGHVLQMGADHFLGGGGGEYK